MPTPPRPLRNLLAAVHSACGWVSYRLGWAGVARRRFERVLLLRGADFRAYVHLGRIAFDHGDYAGWRREFEHARRADPIRFARLRHPVELFEPRLAGTRFEGPHAPAGFGGRGRDDRRAYGLEPDDMVFDGRGFDGRGFDGLGLGSGAYDDRFDGRSFDDGSFGDGSFGDGSFGGRGGFAGSGQDGRNGARALDGSGFDGSLDGAGARATWRSLRESVDDQQSRDGQSAGDRSGNRDGRNVDGRSVDGRNVDGLDADDRDGFGHGTDVPLAPGFDPLPSDPQAGDGAPPHGGRSDSKDRRAHDPADDREPNLPDASLARDDFGSAAERRRFQLRRPIDRKEIARCDLNDLARRLSS